MSEPVKAADVINAILAGLAKRDTQDVNTMHPNTLQEIIADLACGPHCGCKVSFRDEEMEIE